MAASIIYVIARMNFLFDRSQPLHLTAGTICDVFQASKRTVGAKATEIESQLRLHRFSESGLCRSEFVEMFTEVRLPNGIVLPWKMAQQWGRLPPDARPEDFLNNAPRKRFLRVHDRATQFRFRVRLE